MPTTVVNLLTVKPKEQYNDIYIGRPSIWGNPFVIGKDGTREEVIAKYRKWAQSQPTLLKSLPLLKGKRLKCFCKPLPCHGDILVELIEKESNN